MMNNQNQSQPLLKKEYIVIYDMNHTNAASNYFCIRAIVGVISLIIFIVVIIIVIKQSS